MKDCYLWCDFIERSFLEDQFLTLVEKRHVFGATSNPVLFAKALSKPAYRGDIAKLKSTKSTAKDIYENLVITDIKRCAQILLPLWEQNKATGYISLEIDPFLADQVQASIKEALSLFKRINMPNVMIKVPATQSGLEIMQHLASHNIPLNATLVFDPKQAQDCTLALLKTKMAVVSIFVSRIDTLVNHKLSATQAHFKNQVGITNALACYDKVRAVSDQIYPLFASTGVKDLTLPKDYYLQALKLEHSISTAPLDALDAYYNSPSSPFIKKEEINLQNLNLAYKQLLDEGLSAFKSAFEELLKSLA